MHILSKKNMIKKGFEAERIALKACQELKSEGKIIDFWDTGNVSGMDIIIYTKDEIFFPLEVKSSWLKVEKHFHFHNTPCLVISLKHHSPRNYLVRKKVKQTKRRILEILECHLESQLEYQ